MKFRVRVLVAAASALSTLAEGADETLLREIEEAQLGVMKKCIPEPSSLFVQLVEQADERETPIKISKEDELFTEYGLNKLTERAHNALTSMYCLQGRSVTFLEDVLIVHPHKSIEENVRKRIQNMSRGFYLKA